MGTITVAGVGLTPDQLTFGIARRLKSGARVVLHTARAGVADWLTQNGIPFEALDRLYESEDDFDAHARAAADYVTSLAAKGDIIYCVFDVRDVSAVLLAHAGARVIPGPPLEGALLGMIGGEVTVASASDWEALRPDASRATLIRELDSRQLVSEIKLRLMEAYPDDASIDVLIGGGIARISLYELDRLAHYDHSTAALIYPEHDLAKKPRCTVSDLDALIRRDADAYMREEYDDLCHFALRLFGGAAYAEDRGEYGIYDIFTDVCYKLLNR